MKTMRKYFLATVLVGTIAAAPTKSLAVSEYVLPWLLFSMGARASGMGGAQMTEATGADAVYWNPALLGIPAGTRDHRHAFRPVPDLTDDVYFEYASYAQKVEELGWRRGWKLDVPHLRQSTATDPSGLVIQDFSSWEMGMGMGYGAAVSSKVAVGGGVKFLMSRLSPKD
jgi:hypothetical protein